MKVQCVCVRVHDNRKDDEVACVCKGTLTLLSHPTPPHPTANDDESAMPVSSRKDDEGAQVNDFLALGAQVSEILGAQVSVWQLK